MDWFVMYSGQIELAKVWKSVGSENTMAKMAALSSFGRNGRF
jgi:hypothetical protein